MSLNAIATPAARGPEPLVTLVRNRTVANVDSIGFEVFRRIQCSAGKVADREQLVEVIGDLRGDLGKLDTVGVRELLRGSVSVPKMHPG